MSRWKIKESTLLGEKYYFARHKSGLSIYVLPKQMSITYAALAVNYGSIDNITNDKGDKLLPGGIAHFLEHKLFANEDGSDSFERFSALGADANAYTAYNRTVYLFSCTDRFEPALTELLDFVTHPHFTDESVDKEQGIIAEEIRMCMDDPYDRCYRNMLRGLYRTHAIREDICGSESSIATITPEILYKAYQSYYTLSNMALVICGDVCAESVWEIVDNCLQTFEEGSLPRRCTESEPASVASSKMMAKGQVAKPIFSIGVKDVAVPASSEARIWRDAAMEILCEMLFSDTGELYNGLLDAGLISPEFSSGYDRTRDVGFWRLASESDEPERVLEEVQSFLARVRSEGLSKEEFEHCKRIIFAEYIKGFDSTEEISENFLAFVLEDADLFDYAEVLRGVTFESVQAIFDSFFDPARFTLSVVRPN